MLRQCGHRAAAGRGTLAGRVIGEALDGQRGQCGISASLGEPILQDPLPRIERCQLVESHTADRDLHQFVFGHADRALLLSQEIASCVEQGREGDQAHQLGSGDPQAARFGLPADLLERDVQRSNREIGQVHGHLGDSVLLDVPADRLHGLERARNHHGLASRVIDHLARQSDRPRAWAVPPRGRRTPPRWLGGSK